jgi:predicted Zn-dependent peptidase
MNYPKLGEQAFRRVLPNGLTVIVVPRAGATRKLCYFATDFGSIHRRFLLDGKEHAVPAGIAHYLEHKMFDLPERDVSAELAELGANVNAFTSYDMTAYYFSCTENFEKNLDILLEFVSTPYFTEESVRKEQGIIAQEIGMNRDAPESVVFERLMEQMYREHDIRTPILGTEQTIGEITVEDLYLCHRGFYVPGNMVLCVVGDVDPDRVEALALARLGSEPKPVAQKLPQGEGSMECITPEHRERMEVAMPTFQMGFKCEPIGIGPDSVRQELVADLAAEALFGESSELYLRLYEQGLIDQSFGGGFETVDGCAILMCGGDSREPETVRQAILEEAARIGREGVEEGAFLRMKRSAMGRRIRDLDSFDSTCFRMCAYHFARFDYFEFPRVYESVTVEEIQEFLRTVAQPERCALSVIVPIGGN